MPANGRRGRHRHGAKRGHRAVGVRGAFVLRNLVTALVVLVLILVVPSPLPVLLVFFFNFFGSLLARARIIAIAGSGSGGGSRAGAGTSCLSPSCTAMQCTCICSPLTVRTLRSRSIRYILTPHMRGAHHLRNYITVPSLPRMRSCHRRNSHSPSHSESSSSTRFGHREVQCCACCCFGLYIGAMICGTGVAG